MGVGRRKVEGGVYYLMAKRDRAVESGAGL